MVTIAMAVLIVVGTAALLVMISRRGGAPAVSPMATVQLDEPMGTRIAGIAYAGDRLAVWLAGGGGDRVVLLDMRTGTVAGRVGLRAASQ